HLEMWVRPLGVRRAVVNLVENAVRYGSEAALELTADGDSITICITDNGPGIPEESMMLVREPFVRLDHARQRDTNGFGLGLSIVERAVALEGGVFTLTNRDDGGLAAMIRLPIRAASAA
ncbi:MAG: two-component sensor histidine kinase, partial [Sphingomonadales bacterium]|nr:two-component sensor histidine kinase [Sphingomonadales bacterium]